MIDYLPLLLKTIITLLCVALAILSIFKEWKIYKLIVSGWLFYGIITAVSIWLNPYLEKQAEVKLKTIQKPDVNIEILERSDSQIILSIQATHKKTLIKTLSLKFNIPGVFKNVNLETLERAGMCKIYSSFQAGTSHETITETVHVWCENLSPNSFIRAEINYSPTLPRPIHDSKSTPYEKTYMPLMDLHDYSKCVYSWMFQGEEITETKYKNLENLKFIQKDNENLLYIFQKQAEWRKPNDENLHKESFTKEWLEKSERDRKDW